MNVKRDNFIKISGIVLTVTLLAGMILLRSLQNYDHRNYLNSNFFFFWLAGRMELTGQNPYDQVQYLAGHDSAGFTWKPNKIFPYPLPLAILMVPLGMLSLPNAYLAWQIVSQVIMALTCFTLFSHWYAPPQKRMLLPLMVFLLFFGPVFLSLQVGSIGAIALLVVLGSILFYENKKTFMAGMILSLTMLKPPQGLTIILLAGVWFLSRKDWKAILGMASGGIALFLIGILQDPAWVTKFLVASQAVLDRSQGVNSNVWGLAFRICKGASPCSPLLGSASALIVLVLGSLFLWKKNIHLTVWEAFNFIIPLAFFSTIYLWSYDQILYIVPITWIVGMLVEMKKSYIQAFIFLVVLVLSSLIELAYFSYTHIDIWSIGNTFLVLGMVFWLMALKQRSPTNVK